MNFAAKAESKEMQASVCISSLIACAAPARVLK